MEIHGANIFGEFKPQEYETLPLYNLHAHLGRIIYVKNANNDNIDIKDNYFFGTLSGWLSLVEITSPNGCGLYPPYLGGTGATGATGGTGSPGSTGGTGCEGTTGPTGGSGGSGGSGGTGGSGGPATGGTGGTGSSGNSGISGGTGGTGYTGGTGGSGGSGGTGYSGGSGGTGCPTTGGTGAISFATGGSGGSGGKGPTGGTGGCSISTGGTGGTGGTSGTGGTGGCSISTGGTGGVGSGGSGGSGGTGSTGGSGHTGGTGGTGRPGSVKCIIGEIASPKYFRIFNVTIKGITNTTKLDISIQNIYNAWDQPSHQFSAGDTYGLITYRYEKTYLELNINSIYCECRTVEQQYGSDLVDCWSEISNNKVNLYFDNKQLIYPFIHLTDISDYLKRSNEYIIYQLMCICK